jgi:hypothetical protein
VASGSEQQHSSSRPKLTARRWCQPHQRLATGRPLDPRRHLARTICWGTGVSGERVTSCLIACSGPLRCCLGPNIAAGLHVATKPPNISATVPSTIQRSGSPIPDTSGSGCLLFRHRTADAIERGDVDRHGRVCLRVRHRALRRGRPFRCVSWIILEPGRAILMAEAGSASQHPQLGIAQARRTDNHRHARVDTAELARPDHVHAYLLHCRTETYHRVPHTWLCRP